MVSLPFRAWVRAVAESMQHEAWGLECETPRRSLPLSAKRLRSPHYPGSLADLIWYRADALRNCLRGIVGDVCKCGRPAEASAQLFGTPGHNQCHSRLCPRCARVRAAQMREWGGELEKFLPYLADTAEGEGVDFRLRFVTLTQEYRPFDADEMTIDALRERWRRMREAWRHILDRVRLSIASKRLRSLVGAWACVEMAGTGHVHMHVLYFGPWIDKDEWKAWGREVFPEFGHLDPEEADASAIAHMCHYPLKGPGGRATRWFAGGKCVDDGGSPALIHPTLAARWEIAMFGRRIGDRYGSFRRVRSPDAIAITEEPARPARPCPSCGAVEWKRLWTTAADWVKRCDAHGVKEHLGNPRAVNRRE